VNGASAPRLVRRRLSSPPLPLHRRRLSYHLGMSDEYLYALDDYLLFYIPVLPLEILPHRGSGGRVGGA
jgi:hypothetical protein